MQLTPQEYRGKMARMLACKCALAARHDYFAHDVGADFGHVLRQKVDEKTIQFNEDAKRKAELEEEERLQENSEDEQESGTEVCTK